MMKKNASQPDHPSQDDRLAAEKKLRRLFRSFGVDALGERERLIDPYVDRAFAFWRPNASVDVAAIALQEAEDDLEVWFASLLSDHLEERGSAVMTGRAAFLMCGGPSRWADQLLRPRENLSDDFIGAIGGQVPSAVPPSEIGEMHHQPYEPWSPAAMLAGALPVERGLLQSFGWRNAGPTS